MKKKLIIVLAILVVVIIGAVTIKFINPGKKALLSELTDNEVTKAPSKNATLTFYFEAQEPDVTREVLDEVEKKAKDKLNIKLDFKFVYDYPEGYLNTIKTTIASGQPCDGFQYYLNGFKQNLKSLADEGIIKDLTTLFPENAPKYYKQFSKEALKAMSFNTKIYAIPNYLPTSNMQCAIVREDLMKKYNIPDINSYESYEQYLKTIKEKEPDMIPSIFYETAIGLFAEANGYIILDYPQGLVYKWDDPSMKIVAWEQTPEFKEGIKTIERWYANKYLLKGVGIGQIDNSMVTSGKYASFISVFGSELGYNSTLFNEKFSWKYKAYPLYPDKLSARNSPLEAAIVVNAKSQNIDRLIMFINWLQSNQENYDSLMYGIKGKHYILKDNKVVLPEGTEEESSYLSWPWRLPFTNIKYERVDGSADEAAINEYNEIINTRTKYPPHMGFVPDYTSVYGIFISRGRSFYQIEQKIFTDTLKQQDVEEYIKSEKDNGVEKLVNEVQRQLDKWKVDSTKAD